MAAICNDRPLSMYDNLHVTHTPKDTYNTNATILYDRLTNGKIELENEGNATRLRHNENHQLLTNSDGNLNKTAITKLRQNVNAINDLLMPSTVVNQLPAVVTTEIREKLSPINLTQLDATLYEKPVITTNATTEIKVTNEITIPTVLISTNNSNNVNNDILTNRVNSIQSESAAFNIQKITSELNGTGHNIAAVKAALNEAKSKFFGLNSNYIIQQQQQQQQQEHQQQQQQQHEQQLTSSTTSLYYNETNEIGNFLEKNSCMNEIQQQQLQQQSNKIEQSVKSTPTYQNIPENSIAYRNHYQQQQLQLQQQQQQQQQLSLPPSRLHDLHGNNIIGMNDIIMEKLPKITTTIETESSATTTTTTYKQVLLNDIDNNLQQPSQAVYMATTVPQNIKGSKIAGRHTPTRSSLRHSRMLVVNNKSCKVDGPHSSTMNFPQIRLIRCLIILQIIVASTLIGLSIWQFLLAPTTSVQDNTYWSALVLLFTGILNINLIRYECVNIKRYKGQRRVHCFKFLRINSHVLSILAILLCFVALILASLHYGRLSADDTKCESTNILLEQGSCTCTFHYLDHFNDANDTNNTNNSTTVLLAANVIYNGNENQNYKFEYRDLSCEEVSGVWLKILTYSIVLNSIGIIITVTYIILLICYRTNNKTKYNSVPTNL